MTGFGLKLLAVFCMAADHVGAVLFPDILLLRVIGRLAFPMFGFLLAEGAAYTKNSRNYLIRLFVFALISEIPFDLAFTGVPFDLAAQNVFFTLFLGLCTVQLYRRFFSTPLLWAVGGLLCCTIAELIQTDYGCFGVAAVFLFYLLRKERAVALLAFALLDIGYSAAVQPMQFFAAGACLPLAFYKDVQGRKCKYLFYCFYPLHLLMLWGIKVIC